MNLRTAWSSCALVLGATVVLIAAAQNAGGGPSPAQRAIEYRQSIMKVVSGNFGPIGNVLAGRGEYNAEDIAKRAERVAFLATLEPDAYPDISKDGNTKAKPEAFTDKAGLAMRIKNFEDSSAALATLVKTDKTNSPAFKAAAGKVADACKGCHDNYRAK